MKPEIYFSILMYFPETPGNVGDIFYRSIKSILGQKYTNWKIVVLGTESQINDLKEVLESIKLSQSIANTIELVQVKTYSEINLNLAFKFLGTQNQNLQNNQGIFSEKLIFLQIGDYLSSDFLAQSADFLYSLELHKNGSQPILALSDFKYIDSKSQVFDSKFVLKSNVFKAAPQDFIYNPKFLLHPFQFFWDIKLLQHFTLSFDHTLKDLDLSIAKFNLDYILALASLNNFIFPSIKINPDTFYVSSNSVAKFIHTHQKNRWSLILETKREQLDKLGIKKSWWRDFI